MTDHFANARRALRRALVHSTAPNADALAYSRRLFDALTGGTDPEFAGADRAFAARKVMLLCRTCEDMADLDAVGIVHQIAPDLAQHAAEFADRDYLDMPRYRALHTVVTVAEIVQRYGLTRTAVSKAIANGRLPARRSGDTWLVMDADAEELWHQDKPE